MMRKKYFAFSVFTLLFALLLTQYAGPTLGEANEDVITTSLVSKLKIAEPDSVFDLIIQFEDELRDSDLRILTTLDFKIIQTFHIIPGVHAQGSRDAIISLSNYHRTYWIETNDMLDYNLEVSTSTINATNTWNRVVNDFGSIQDPIDGRDITVVVADTGIDGTHPDLDYKEKVILNLKKDIDHPGMWKEMENTDTFFGHGTHCAGIVGGTGEASGGARRGVAPAVNLIGLSIGDPWETNEVGCLEWVYDNSRPNANHYNIKVVSNSWGYEDFDESFKDAVMEATRKLTYDNNVVVVFAASNDGEEDHDGHVSTTNIYGNVPCAISVAAAQRDGIGMADFSSRGHRDQNDTWPDITAPGVRIWSARDSSGLMGIGNTDDKFYIPASGTSMATPHIAGVVALLFQAAPSLRISDVHDDSSSEDLSHWEDDYTRIHEAEYILKTTSEFMTEGDGLADNFSISLEQRPHDYAQGYGLVNVEKAVALALTLEKMREDDPETSVREAFKNYSKIINDTTTKSETDVLVASWNGEYTLANDQNEKPLFNTNQAHYVFISNESRQLILDLSFPPVNLDDNTIGSVAITLDYDDDGSVDWSGELFGDSTLSGQKHDEIDISGGEFATQRGKLWAFSIYGYALSNFRRPGGSGNPVIRSYRSPTIEYAISVQQVLDLTDGDNVFVDYVDARASVAQLAFGEPTNDYEEGTIELHLYEYNLSRIYYVEEDIPDMTEDDTWWLLLIMDIILGLIVIAVIIRKYLRERNTGSKILSK